MSKQTVVEWLQEEITNRQNGNGDSKSMNEIFDQALAMEKEQIEDAYHKGFLDIDYKPKGYYNSTYKNNS